MKTSIYTLTAIIVFASCKKADMPVTSTGYTGTFELRARHGGIAGINEKYEAGNKNILQLNADSTYRMFVKGAQTSAGRFRLKKNAYTYGNIVYDWIYYDADTYGTEVRLHGDTLTLGTDITDNIATDYKRIK
ncbi:hypothetical protein [Mucilaginibacter psychrotolerans]|uniref:Uncharacterized protein n=1 Tax=Mucilaginibacter psychrotolerans TaxID=1524096 RepID=A0A4Y8SE07_9SPHI|nr:hypothetical protein [Mucilaginibacter psychrotolerans]TFF36901.1 hypothetical protein E2R66_14165 [Mucilaginibacter psychrotolerans]